MTLKILKILITLPVSTVIGDHFHYYVVIKNLSKKFNWTKSFELLRLNERPS